MCIRDRCGEEERGHLVPTDHRSRDRGGRRDSDRGSVVDLRSGGGLPQRLHRHSVVGGRRWLLDCGAQAPLVLRLTFFKAHAKIGGLRFLVRQAAPLGKRCLLYTSDAADELPCVDLGDRRLIKKNTTLSPHQHHH